MTVHHGDCLDVLRTMPDNSVDSIVTDPPYGLSFMGKRWDYDVPGVEIWAECLRVLKPGGHLLSFAGTRTHHRMAVRIEDAGFQIRDMVAWVYGSGFPKSLDVSKAIDKVAPRIGQFDAFARHFSEKLKESGKTQKEVAQLFPSKTGGITGCVWNWANGANVPTVEQWKILKPLLNLSPDWLCLIERIEAEREVVGTKDANLLAVAPGQENDRSRTSLDITAPATDAAKQWEGWGTALKPSFEPITLARKPFAGTVAQNVLEHGTGALNIDGCRVEGRERTEYGLRNSKRSLVSTYGVPSESADFDSTKGRWPANLIHDGSDEVVGLFPVSNGDTGSAARFFYCAKASKADRGADNRHPTVKPTDLMRYICRLITPPGGIVLDPFAGSGSTGKAAALEGFGFIGIEREAEYVEIARARIEAECTQVGILA